ncbi:MAG: hypothetical protein ACTSRW_14995 [Candidatus Helarchaeota archaeon]
MDDKKFAYFELKARNSTLMNITKEMINKLTNELHSLEEFQKKFENEVPLHSIINPFEDIEKKLGLIFRAYESAYEE